MKEKICECCGAPLKQNGWDGWICEYCGTKYNTGMKDVHIQVHPSGCLTLMAQAEINDYWVKYNKEAAVKEITRQLTTSLADTLKEYLTIQESIDPLHDRRIYRGMINIIPDGGRYY